MSAPECQGSTGHGARPWLKMSLSPRTARVSQKSQVTCGRRFRRKLVLVRRFGEYFSRYCRPSTCEFPRGRPRRQARRHYCDSKPGNRSIPGTPDPGSEMNEPSLMPAGFSSIKTHVLEGPGRIKSVSLRYMYKRAGGTGITTPDGNGIHPRIHRHAAHAGQPPAGGGTTDVLSAGQW